MPISKNKIELLNIQLNSVDRYNAIDIIESLTNKKTGSLACTVNVEFIMRAQKDAEFREILNNKSALNTIDGAGVIWGYHYLTSWKPKLTILKQIYCTIQWLLYILCYPVIAAALNKKHPRLSGSDLVWDICKWAADNNKSIFILGYKGGLDPNAVQKASLELQTKIYGLKIAGALAIYGNTDEEKQISADIKRSGADILLCGLGSPLQEVWLSHNLGRSGAKFGIGLGGTFDFISGAQKRAPLFWQRIGCEWLYRLLRQPKRLKRQLALINFTYIILRQKLLTTETK